MDTSYPQPRSRRSIIKALAVLPFAVAAYPAARRAHAQNKIAKEQVQYQKSPKGDQKCGNCIHFLADQNACRLVEGNISANDWCGLWTAKP